MDEDGGLGLPRGQATMAACIEVAAGAAELNSCRGWALHRDGMTTARPRPKPGVLERHGASRIGSVGQYQRVRRYREYKYRSMNIMVCGEYYIATGGGIYELILFGEEAPQSNDKHTEEIFFELSNGSIISR